MLKLSHFIRTPYNIFRLFIAFFCIQLGTASANEPEPSSKWYQIEYVIFEHLQTDDHILRYEDTPLPTQENKQYSYVITGSNPASPYQYTQLQDHQTDLESAIQKLKRSNAVEVLETHAWQQALDENVSTPPIKIYAEVSKQRTLVGELQLDKRRYTHAKFELFLTQEISLPYQDIKDWFLEIEPSLPVISLVMPVADETPILESIGVSKIYQNVRYLGESRRIKEGEIHYIDHPVISAIITMKEVPSPYELINDLAYAEQ